MPKNAQTTAQLHSMCTENFLIYKLDSEKVRGTRDQMANIHWIMGKAREFQKNIYFCLIDYAKAFDCVDHNQLWKILQEMGIPDRYVPTEISVCRSRSNI